MALTPMTKIEFLEACDAHALGALDPIDRERFHLALPDADVEMKEALDEALHTAELLSLTVSAAAPGPAVRARLMAQVAAQVTAEVKADTAGAKPARKFQFSEEPQPSLIQRLFGAGIPSRLGLAGAFSLLIVAVALVTYSLSLKEKLNGQTVALLDTHSRMDALADSTRSRITALQDSLSRKEAMLDIIRSKGMQMVAMGGMEDTARYGKIIWDPERKVAILQVSLPPEPDGMSYQLWVIRDNKPMDAGVFQMNAGSDGMYRIEQLVETDRKHINAFAVTMEPKGGMPQPTGKMYLMGEI
jgi:hypothetical protein